MSLKQEISPEEFKNSIYYGKRKTDLYGIFLDRINNNSGVNKLKELNLLGFALTFDCIKIKYDIIEGNIIKNNKIRKIATIDNNISLIIEYRCIGCEMCHYE